MKTEEISSSIYNQMVHENMNQSKEELFKQTLLGNLHNSQTPLEKSNALTFENINQLSTAQINTIFHENENKDLVNNLKLATQFSNDAFLSQPLFNNIFSKDITSGHEFLVNLYEDKKWFLEEGSSLSDLLEQSIKSGQKSKKITEQIPQEDLDKILTTVNSFNFVSALSNTTSSLKDKYNDDENYSALFGAYQLEYEKLKIAYEDEKYKQMNLIKQF